MQWGRPPCAHHSALHLPSPCTHPPQMERGLGWQGNRFVPIRRTHILFDGFDQLSKLGEGLRGRVRVQMINQHGEAEAGGWPAGQLAWVHCWPACNARPSAMPGPQPPPTSRALQQTSRLSHELHVSARVQSLRAAACIDDIGVQCIDDIGVQCIDDIGVLILFRYADVEGEGPVIIMGTSR